MSTPKQHRAVLLYADGVDGAPIYLKAERDGFVPYYKLPATPEAYDAQVEAMAKASFTACGPFVQWQARKWVKLKWKDANQAGGIEAAKIALAAIGVKRPKGAK